MALDYETFRRTIAEMDDNQRQITLLLYMKDIKDLLQTLLESQNITPKHY